VFGKLWGVFASITKFDPADENILSMNNPGELFYRLKGFAQDCDTPDDYDRLCYVLDNMVSKHES
jgi:hypothetical protein